MYHILVRINALMLSVSGNMADTRSVALMDTMSLKVAASEVCGKIREADSH